MDEGAEGLPEAAPAAWLPPRELAQRRDAIAQRWYEAIAPTGFTAWSPAVVFQHVTSWTGQFIASLAEESGREAEAQSIGEALAELGYLQPEALGRTLTVLGQALLTEAPLRESEGDQPRLTALLGALATGFLRRAHEMILSEQEAIRRALVAQRDEMAAALNESEARYGAIFGHSALGIALLDLEGHLLDTNPALHRIFGYAAEELRHADLLTITHPDDRAKSRDFYDRLMTGRLGHGQIEKRYYQKDGRIVHARLTMSLVRDADGRPRFVIAMVEDVTARKQAEVDREEAYRRLTERVEVERVRLARELHDGVVQDLEAVRLYLGAHTVASPADVAERAWFEQVQAMVLQRIHSLRETAGELRPPTLVPFGLASALEAHTDGLADTHPDLAVHRDIVADGTRLPELMRLALYRIYQVAIDNVVRHARGRQVWIRLVVDDNLVSLEVRDDGRGFVKPANWLVFARQGHYGLLGADEYAKALGADLEVVTAPEHGTTVRVVASRVRPRLH